MKKISKLIIMIIMVFFLAGCGWEDVQKEYSDLLNEGVTCTYYTEEKNAAEDFFGVEKIELSADYNGFYVNAGAGKATILDKSGANNFIDVNGYQFNFHNDFIKGYLNYYKEKSACAERIYVRGDTQEVRLENCEGLTYCASYALKTVTITTPEGEEKDCHHSLATNCQKFSKGKDNFGNKAYIEIGYYNLNGSTKKYFGISGNENYKDIIIDDNESDGLAVYHNLEWYEIPTAAISEIWLSNGKFISPSDVIIKSDYVTYSKYYITGSEETNYGIYDNTGDVEEQPDIDPDNINNETIEDNYISNLNYNNLCANSGVASVMVLIGYLIKIIAWIVPLIIIILGMIDYGKAAISNDEMALQKATGALVRRFIAGVIIFVIPTFVNVLTTGLLKTSITNTFVSCTNCMSDPESCRETVKELKAKEDALKIQLQNKNAELWKEQLEQQIKEQQSKAGKYSKSQIMAMSEEEVKNMSNEEFIEFMASAARIVYKEYGGVLPSITIAQAILESGYGNSFETTSHNVFGLIGYPAEKPKVNRLRKFDNFYEGTYYHYLYFEYYSNVYSDFLEYCDNNQPLEAAKLLHRYAGGSETYGPIIVQLINQYDLTKYDS